MYVVLTCWDFPNRLLVTAEFKDEVTWIEFPTLLTQTASNFSLWKSLFLPTNYVICHFPHKLIFRYLISAETHFPNNSSVLLWGFLFFMQLRSSPSRLCMCLFVHSSLNQQTQHFSTFSAPFTYINPQTQMWEHVLEVNKRFDTCLYEENMSEL